MKLPYSFLPTPSNAAFPQRTELTRPIVALLLHNGDRQSIVFALVDSGADSCVFPASVAIDPGLELTQDKAADFSGSAGSKQTAYYAEVQATLLPMEAPNIDSNQEPLSFPLYAGFCETLEHVGMGLLGQDGFFSQFHVNFHHRYGYFEIL